MSKAVLISIKPEWCGMIALGEKTIEIRKTRPKIEPPFKCYIYCTLPKSSGDIYLVGGENPVQGNGKVIGEFVCDKVAAFRVFENGTVQDFFFEKLKHSCLSYDEIAEYIGKGKVGYSWHISNLVIYDKPKELSEFVRFCSEWEKEEITEKCISCKYFYRSYEECKAECEYDGEIPVTRPPQSWCYVEEVS